MRRYHGTARAKTGAESRYEESIERLFTMNTFEWCTCQENFHKKIGEIFSLAVIYGMATFCDSEMNRLGAIRDGSSVGDWGIFMQESRLAGSVSIRLLSRASPTD
jgi:hypothetical protein